MRIIGIDYGLRRTGIAVTDMEQIIASPLKVVDSTEIISFLKDYFLKEPVEGIVIGMPKNLDNTDTHSTQLVKGLIKKLKVEFSSLYIQEVDERFTSKIAKMQMLESGINKTARKDKSRIDQLSAELILTDFLRYKSNFLK